MTIFQMSQMYAPQYDPQRNGGQVITNEKLRNRDYNTTMSFNLLTTSNMTILPQIYPGYGAAMYTNMYHR